MESPVLPTSRDVAPDVAQARAEERKRLEELNTLARERAQREWVDEKMAYLTMRGLALRVQKVILELTTDLMKGRGIRESLIYAPDRWAPVGIFLLLLSFLLYLIDVLG
jgi:hypothetical protein